MLARGRRALLSSALAVACAGASSSGLDINARGVPLKLANKSATRAQLPLAPELRDSVIWYAGADHIFPPEAIGLQCQGVNDTLVRARAAVGVGINANVDADPLRFAIVRAPDGVPALRLEVDARDSLPPHFAPRCELLGYPTPATALPVGRPFWYAVEVRLDDWSKTEDEQIIIQWHHDHRLKVLNPMFAVIVKGDRLSIVVRRNTDDDPVRSTTTTIAVGAAAVPFGRWIQFIARAELHEPGSDNASTLKLWMNGMLLADYRGDLGYRLPPSSHAYAKVGIYHWTNGNPWDERVPRRTVLLRRALLIQDRDNSYSLATIAHALAGQATPPKSSRTGR